MDKIAVKNYWFDLFDRMTEEVSGFNEFLADPCGDYFHGLIDHNDNMNSLDYSDGYEIVLSDGTKISMYCGCTRAVFVTDDCDYVAKICFRNKDNDKGIDYIDWSGECKYGDEDERKKVISECYGIYDDMTEETREAVDDACIDYCATEARIYREAKKRGLEQFFAETWLMDDYDFVNECGDQDNVAIYAMVKCDVGESVISDSAYDYLFDQYCSENGYDTEDENEMDSARESFYFDGDSDDMLEYALCTWNDDHMEGRFEIENFIEDMDIRDLHSGNWGFRNGELVMCDYASYCRIAGILFE